MPHDVLLLAAGFGTRMGDLTAQTPKPLVALNGRPMIDHIVSFADDAALSISVNAHFLSHQVIQHFATRPDVHVFVEEPEILDTGGGVKNAARQLGAEQLFTCNTDGIFLGPNPFTLFPDNFSSGVEALLLVAPMRNVVAHSGGGDFVQTDTGDLEFGKGEFVFTGLQMIRTNRFLASPSDVFSTKEVWSKMIGQKALFPVIYPGQWVDAGHPEGLREAANRLRRGEA